MVIWAPVDHGGRLNYNKQCSFYFIDNITFLEAFRRQVGENCPYLTINSVHFTSLII